MTTSMTLTTGSMQTFRNCSQIRAAQPKNVLGLQRLAPATRCVLRRGSEQFHGDKVGVPRPDTNDKLEQVDDVKEPGIDQTKIQNVQPGNISSENAERRADIGATRPPTLLGQSPAASDVSSTQATSPSPSVAGLRRSPALQSHIYPQSGF